jgi:multiple sugar transport system ATP-binding protein
MRPEDIHNPDFAAPGIIARPVDANIEVVELMGNEIFVHMKSGEHTFVARVDPRSRYHMGQDAQLTFNMANMHLFDAETEKAIR